MTLSEQINLMELVKASAPVVLQGMLDEVIESLSRLQGLEK